MRGDIQSVSPTVKASGLNDASTFFAVSDSSARSTHTGASRQGLTLVHFSAQRKRFMWDRGCMYGVF